MGDPTSGPSFEFKDSGKFAEFYGRLAGRPNTLQLPRTLIALDPGETTGISIFGNEGPILRTAYQENTSIIPWGIEKFHKLIDTLKGQFPGPLGLWMVIEDYRIYSWKSKEHNWSNLHTPRLIGVIETLCYQYKVPLYKQSAQVGKSFCTDERLKSWDYWLEGRQHARDSIRHGAQFFLFHQFTKEELSGGADGGRTERIS